MSKPIGLSHSALGKFTHCPMMYKLHYLDKIRPVGTTSSLVFGSAIDKACENYLLEGNVEQAFSIFKQAWDNIQDGVKEQDGTITPIDFHSNDFDHELLLQSDNESIIENTI